MNGVLLWLGIVLGPLALAVLFALWDDNFSARHKLHAETITRMQARTDEAWDAYLRRESARRGAACPECGLEWGYHRPYCRAWSWPGAAVEREPWIPA